MNRSVAILGAGLSGAATALHLLADHASGFGIDLVDPGAVLGAGLAYGTTDPAHRTNVAAARMSVFPDDPARFDRWLRARGMPEADPAGVAADGGLFAQRALFGAFVDAELRALAARGRGAFRHVRARAVAAAPMPGGGWRVALDDGGEIGAAALVLATSHTAPDMLPALAPVAGRPGIVADPWDAAALGAVAARGGPVLVVGTGLTGCDVAGALRGRGHRAPIHLVSRRGLLPRPRTTRPVEPFGDFATAPARTARALLHRVRAAIAQAAVAGQPWEAVIDALRKQGSAVWNGLDAAERHRLLRHLRPFWDVHRFQSAPPVDAMLAAGLAAGDLVLHAASIASVAAAPGGYAVQLRPRGGRGAEELRVAAIVNCTGPGHRSVVERDPVLRSLAASAGLRADEWRLGIAVDGESRVLGAGGAWPDLFVAGPLARGTHGELMGLPQVSTQPRAVAASIVRLLADQSWTASSSRRAVSGPSR